MDRIIGLLAQSVGTTMDRRIKMAPPATRDVAPTAATTMPMVRPLPSLSSSLSSPRVSLSWSSWSFSGSSSTTRPPRSTLASATTEGGELSIVEAAGALVVGINVGARVGVSVGRVEGAGVEGADVDGAKVDGAEVDGAEVEGADVDGSDVDGADVVGATVGMAVDGFEVGCRVVGAGEGAWVGEKLTNGGTGTGEEVPDLS